MAAVPITINCVIYPKAKGGAPKPYPAVITGYAWRSDVGVDISPPTDQPHPEHPIVIPPAPPVDGSEPHPEHPIVLPPEQIPPEPPEIPTDPGMVKPPPPEGGWGWSPVYGWGYFPGSGGKQPKK